MTKGEMEHRFIAQLAGQYDKGESASLAFIAIEDICDLGNGSMFANKDTELSREQEQLLLKVLEGLREGSPLQYLLGIADFYGFKFKVAPGVLIPRPETEELVDWILRDITKNQLNERPKRILDIGTGSGCIPITLKKKLPEVEVISVDVSDDALAIAAKNVAFHETDVRLIKGDILVGNPQMAEHSVDIIVSNPPYITTAEKAEMHANVLNNEPSLALFVPDQDPLIFYRKILELAEHCLVPAGTVYFEINSLMGERMIDLLTEFNFTGVLKQDISGNHRMIKAQKA